MFFPGRSACFRNLRFPEEQSRLSLVDQAAMSIYESHHGPPIVPKFEFASRTLIEEDRVGWDRDGSDRDTCNVAI